MKRSLSPSLPSRRRQRGVGLIEVLIAVLVVSIGFLGIAALQVYSLSTNNSAMARSMATVASYSILDAMRADRDNAKNGAYNTASPLKAGEDSCPDAGDTLASHQLHEWCKQLGHTLGAIDTTTGKIHCTSDGDCTVTITFDDSRASKKEEDGSVADGSDHHQVITEAMI